MFASIAAVATATLAPVAPAHAAAPKQGEWTGYPPREWIDPAIADLQDLGAQLALICSGKAGATAGVPNLLARVGGTLGTMAITKLAGGESPCISSPKIIAIGKELFQARDSWPYVRLTQYKVVRRGLPDACEVQIQVNRLAVPIRYRQLAKEPCVHLGFGRWVKPPQQSSPSGPPVLRTVYEVWRGGAEATAVGYSPRAWSMVDFRVPADSPWIRKVSANVGGARQVDVHVYERVGGGFREIVSANGVGVVNNGETWADLSPTRLSPDKVYVLQLVLPEGGAVYYARQATPGAGMRTYTWCNELPNTGCPHGDLAQNGRIVTSDRP